VQKYTKSLKNKERVRKKTEKIKIKRKVTKKDGARFQKDNSVLKAEQIKKTFRIIELRKVSNYKIKCKSTNKYVYSVELKVDN
jgi:hypothetical protein